MPTVHFVDATAEAGIDFVHTSGRSGRKYGVETIGSGAAFFDYNRDGWMDLYVVNGADLPGYVSAVPPQNALYRNDGGYFAEVGASLGVADAGYGMGASAGDYDNDGIPISSSPTLVATGCIATKDRHRRGSLRMSDGCGRDWGGRAMVNRIVVCRLRSRRRPRPVRGELLALRI